MYRKDYNMKCKICGKEILNQNEINLDEEGGVLCQECADKSKFGRCKECGRVLLAPAVFCADCKNCYLRLENSYGTKPKPRFINVKYKNGVELNRRYYGLEMEFSNTNSFVLYKKNEELYNRGVVYNKCDASLEDGVEVVTQPMDRKSIRHYVTNEFKNIFGLVGNGFRENAGLHIHVNKKSLSSITMVKLSKLFNDSSNIMQNDKDAVAYICGRKMYITSECSDHFYALGQVKANWDKDKLLENEERHIALNLRPDKTIEFRMFKTSKDPKVIISYLDFVDGAIEYATNFGLVDMKISRFVKWLNKNTNNSILKSRTKKTLDTYYTKPEQFDKISVGYTKARELLKQLPKISYYKVLATCSYAKSKEDMAVYIKKIINGEPIDMRGVDFSTCNLFVKDVYDDYLKELKRILKTKEARVCA